MAFLRIICAQRPTNLVYSYSGSGSSITSSTSGGSGSGSASQFYHFGLIKKANRSFSNRCNNSKNNNRNNVTLKNSQAIRYLNSNCRKNDNSNDKQQHQHQRHLSVVRNGATYVLKQQYQRQEQHHHYQQLRHCHHYHQLQHYYIKCHQKVLTRALLSSTYSALPFISSSLASSSKRFLQTDAPKSQLVTQAATINQHASTAERFRPPPPKIPENPQRDPLDVSFNNPLAAFKSKTTSELVRAYVVYTICSFEKIVEHNMARTHRSTLNAHKILCCCHVVERSHAKISIAFLLDCFCMYICSQNKRHFGEASPQNKLKRLVRISQKQLES